MKLLVNIDQKASLAGGHEAPNSTELIEFPISSVSEGLRAWFAEHYNPVTGSLQCKEQLWVSSQGSSDWNGTLTATLPLTQDKVLAAIIALNHEHQKNTKRIEALRKERIDEQRRRIQEIIAAGPTARTVHDSACYGEIKVSGEYLEYDFSTTTAYTDELRKMEADARETIPAEMRYTAVRERVRNEVAEKATTRKAADDAEKEKRLSDLREWVATHGSQLLRERLAGGFDWKPLAESEIADFACSKIELTRVEFDSENYETITDPDLKQIWALKHVQSLIPDYCTAEIGIIKNDSDSDSDDETTGTIVIRVEVGGLARGEVRCFQVKPGAIY